RDYERLAEPVPVVSRSVHTTERFNGPWLRAILKIAPEDDPTSLTTDELIDQTFRDHLVISMVDEFRWMREHGLTSAETIAELTPSEHRIWLERCKKHEIPEIWCSLAEDWDFAEIERIANFRPGHVQITPRQLSLYKLAEIAFDIEDAL